MCTIIVHNLLCTYVHISILLVTYLVLLATYVHNNHVNSLTLLSGTNVHICTTRSLHLSSFISPLHTYVHTTHTAHTGTVEVRLLFVLGDVLVVALLGDVLVGSFGLGVFVASLRILCRCFTL